MLTAEHEEVVLRGTVPWAKPKLIGLTGLAGSGKDLVAAMLRMVGYRRYGFADALRREVAHTYQNPEVLWEKPLNPAVREHLQNVGMERRAEDPAYWIRRVEAQICYEPQVVISDLRFKNEADWVEKWGGVLWRVERPGVIQMSHVSETELHELIPDRTIHNTGDQQHLAAQILAALEEPRGEAKACN